jgi:hypothetical protein
MKHDSKMYSGPTDMLRTSDKAKSMPNITLQCWIIGDPLEYISGIEISPSSTVSALARKIKYDNEELLDCRSGSLSLSAVSVL